MKKIFFRTLLSLSLFILGYITLSLKEFDGGGASTSHTCYELIADPAGDYLAFRCSDCVQKKAFRAKGSGTCNK